ncbi:methylhydantoinase [Rhizobium anhuiense]|uniref:Methylhydantoinase n=1 Tax=Rhizobium anhuiense TaxID=1184720 RepID=A0ABX4J538_9HYPH|nr:MULTISPECIES: hydantoinase/oxoprolinase family protein [Rhizobium]KZS56478.1 methylhydantoinase [Rhizobium anhuiense bv. trifolii]MBB3302423.1 N-methylhydantoinase A [Rhizobium sp. BK112]MBB3371443.1 N-methylhydantoinase A [Rhizobium sp. BK077]MBB3746642.1 N-methylhydantoinase A [Rhizobium sp. BK591]MBB4117303.1 N-methylhydantoinase A [Rhizobium sp. BK226]
MSSTPRNCRVGVDIGGTFTDIALDLDGTLHSTKILTDYTAPERAILKGVKAVADMAGIALSEIGILIHGTTLATNALIERRGAKTAFVTTEGFRDVLEMRTENRFEQYDLNISLPPALIARADRFVIRERIDAQGKVLLALDEASVAAVVEKVAAGGYESVAVGFIHAYANGAHEVAVRDAILKRLPGISVSISSEVSPQMREFERFNTVCANAYVKPAIKSYLDRLVVSLKEIGVGCPVFMIHSGGGIVSVESASEFPVRLVESGPAGGAIFAADIARQHGLDTVLSFDMGGTTAKICLIENQVPKTAKTFEVARTYRFRKGSGMPISIPVVEMVEIGAGGGSIASVDAMRQIRVGPHSAASEPGPACYQRGGKNPTVTDADLILGKLDPANFAGGAIPLSVEASRRAMSDDIGSVIGLDPEASAYGTCEMVDENMANAGRVHTVENGKNISDFTMITFGGAGPLHAARLCEKMGISTFLVPPGAGVGSAIGFLKAPFGYESVRSAVFNLSNFEYSEANRLLQAMKAEALGFVEGGLDAGSPVIERTLFMRYAGQGWDIPVPLADDNFDAASAETIAASFEKEYERFFGRAIEGLDIEIVSWSVKASSPLPPVERVSSIAEGNVVQPGKTRRLFEAAQGAYLEAGIHERTGLTPGDVVKGPAVIVERETSTVLTASFKAVVQRDGCLLVTRI